MSWPARLLVGIVRGYRLLLSAWLGSQCRFTPTCSLYAIDALQNHGAGRGAYLAARRIVRCHPGCAGGLDPVPARFSFWRRGDDNAGPAAPSDSSDDRQRAGMPS